MLSTFANEEPHHVLREIKVILVRIVDLILRHGATPLAQDLPDHVVCLISIHSRDDYLSCLGHAIVVYFDVRTSLVLNFLDRFPTSSHENSNLDVLEGLLQRFLRCPGRIRMQHRAKALLDGPFQVFQPIWHIVPR